MCDYPDGYVCPHCGNLNSHIVGVPPSNNIYEKQFSVVVQCESSKGHLFYVTVDEQKGVVFSRATKLLGE